MHTQMYRDSHSDKHTNPSSLCLQEIPATPSYPDWSNSVQVYAYQIDILIFISAVLTLNAHNLATFLGLLWCWSYPTSLFCLNSCLTDASSLYLGKPGGYLLLFEKSISSTHLTEKLLIFFSVDNFQHPLIPPYGTPVPYPALYPAGGVYAHPNMAPVIMSVSDTRFFLVLIFPFTTMAKCPILGSYNSYQLFGPLMFHIHYLPCRHQIQHRQIQSWKERSLTERTMLQLKKLRELQEEKLERVERLFQIQEMMVPPKGQLSSSLLVIFPFEMHIH